MPVKDECAEPMEPLMSAISQPDSQPEALSELDRQAKDRFVRDNIRRIFAIIYRIVGNAADAQDLTQETFIKALQRQDQLKDPEKAAQWLGRVASNTAIDFLRRRARVSFTGLDEQVDASFDLASPSRRPDDELLRQEQSRKLNDCLNELSTRERAALVLRDVEDMPAQDVARILGCSPATVRSHIANARVKFKALLARRGGAQ